MKLYAGLNNVIFDIKGELQLFRDFEEALEKGEHVYEFSVPELKIFDIKSRMSVIHYVKKIVKYSGLDVLVTPEIIENIMRNGLGFFEIEKYFDVSNEEKDRIKKAHLEFLPLVVTFDKCYHTKAVEKLTMISIDYNAVL